MAEQLETPLKSILNFRDVGKFVNNSSSTVQLQTGQLFRGARPDEATNQDRDSLVNHYGIKSIIDLRTKTEHIEQAQKRTSLISSSELAPQSNSAISGPLQIPGIKYHNINFNGHAFSRMLISKLSWTEFIRLASLMATGYRKDAIKILSPHMEDMGLVGLAINSLDVCTSEIKAIFGILGREENWPLMVHCTQGKDRTGLVVMLCLFLCGVEEEVVEEDYVLSESELKPEMRSRLEELASIGLTEQFAVCPPDVVSSVYRHIGEKYGGVERYLRKVGVKDETVAFVRGKLLAR